LQFEGVDRPHYAYPIWYSLKLAKALGYKKVSIVEFGVAGGGGLLAIENNVKEIQKILDIEVEIYGFDMGSGLPTPKDYRDLPYQWQSGFYQMDVPKLESKLSRAKLVLGDVKETISKFQGAPVACVMMDVDYYSSTMDALKIFELPHLPRVFCYFDDVVGNEISLFSEFTGELLAIADFNKAGTMKIAQLRTADAFLKDKDFLPNLFVMHDFDHPKYATYVNPEDGSSCNLPD